MPLDRPAAVRVVGWKLPLPENPRKRPDVSSPGAVGVNDAGDDFFDKLEIIDRWGGGIVYHCHDYRRQLFRQGG